MKPNKLSPRSPKTNAVDLKQAPNFAHRAMAGVLFFVSGAIGLIYQVVWIKWFSLLLGNSSWAISSVIAAFMAGLGLGSWWAGKNVHRWKNPFAVYGWIELGIAGLGLLSLAVFPVLDVVIAPLYRLWAGQFGLFATLRLLMVFVLLLVPTALMGASLPVLVVGLARYQSFQGAVGWLYGINTVGAAFGVGLTGFYLLPRLGVRLTILSAIILGVAVAAAALAWSTGKGEKPADVLRENPPHNGRSTMSRLFLVTVFLTGALSIFFEVVWTRLLTPILGSSTYAFSIMLCVFLVGIGLGGFLSLFPKPEKFRYRLVIGFLLFLNSVLVIGGLFAVNRLPDVFLKLAALADARLWFFFLSQGLLAGALVFFPSLIMGCVLPLAIVGRYRETGDQGDVVGQIYFFNTVGAIVGSLLAGFVVLPVLGASYSIFVASALSVVLGLILMFSESNMSGPQRFKIMAGCALFFLLLTKFVPQIDFKKLHAGVFQHALKGEKQVSKGHYADLLFLKEGHNTTVSVFRTTDETFLKVGGKTDASMFGDLSTQYLLGHLPMFLAPDAKNACVIGYGSGATVRAVAGHAVDSIDVVELEPAIMEGGRYFRYINNDVLADPRVRVHLEDGRTFLKYQSKTFDVIVSEPSNPWVAGVSALFTTEYYQIVRRRLAENGLYCQWIQLYELSNESMNGMLNTLATEFAYVLLIVNKGDLICLASQKPIRVRNATQLSSLFKRPDVRKTLSDIDITDEYDLFLGYCGSLPDDGEYFPSRVRNTDNNLWLEFRAPVEMYRNEELSFRPAPADILFPRMFDIFYPRHSKDLIAEKLALALEKNRPYAFARIDALAANASNPSLRAKIVSAAGRARRSVERNARQEAEVARAGVLMDEKKDYAGAIRILENIHKDQPRHRVALRNLGWAHFQAGHVADAQRYFLKALEANPFDFVSMNFLGVCLLNLGNAAAAEPVFRKTIEVNPYYQFGWKNLIAQLERSGRTDEAKDLSRKSRAYSREWSVLQ